MVGQNHDSEVCLQHRPILLCEQTVYDWEGLRQHLVEGEIDENENLLVYHPLCDVPQGSNLVLQPVFLQLGKV